MAESFKQYWGAKRGAGIGESSSLTEVVPSKRSARWTGDDPPSNQQQQQHQHLPQLQQQHQPPPQLQQQQPPQPQPHHHPPQQLQQQQRSIPSQCPPPSSPRE